MFRNRLLPQNPEQIINSFHRDPPLTQRDIARRFRHLKPFQKRQLIHLVILKLKTSGEDNSLIDYLETFDRELDNLIFIESSAFCSLIIFFALIHIQPVIQLAKDHGFEYPYIEQLVENPIFLLILTIGGGSILRDLFAWFVLGEE